MPASSWPSRGRFACQELRMTDRRERVCSLCRRRRRSGPTWGQRPTLQYPGLAAAADEAPSPVSILRESQSLGGCSPLVRPAIRDDALCRSDQQRRGGFERPRPYHHRRFAPGTLLLRSAADATTDFGEAAQQLPRPPATASPTTRPCGAAPLKWFGWCRWRRWWCPLRSHARRGHGQRQARTLTRRVCGYVAGLSARR